MTSTEIKQQISDLMTKYENKIKKEETNLAHSSWYSGECDLITEKISIYEEINKELMKLLCSIK